MLTRYVEDPHALELLRRGLAGPFLDGYVEHLAAKELSPKTVRNYVGAVSHFSRWAAKRDLGAIAALDELDLEAFERHRHSCLCFGRKSHTCDRIMERVEIGRAHV